VDNSQAAIYNTNSITATIANVYNAGKYPSRAPT